RSEFRSIIDRARIVARYSVGNGLSPRTGYRSRNNLRGTARLVAGGRPRVHIGTRSTTIDRSAGRFRQGHAVRGIIAKTSRVAGFDRTIALSLLFIFDS